MAHKYVITDNANPSVCLGVASATAGAQVELMPLQGTGSRLTQWEADPDTGIIASVADPNMVFDFQPPAADTTPVVLNPYTPGRTSQSWSWTDPAAETPGYIYNNGAPGFCIDDQGNPNPGVNVYLYQQAAGGNPDHEMWRFTPLSVLERAAKHAPARH